MLFDGKWKKNKICRGIAVVAGLVVLAAFTKGCMQQIKTHKENVLIQKAQLENLTYRLTTAMTVDLNTVREVRPIQIVAHRGYSDVYPENTLAAFEGALDIGVDYIETDVQMTKDGKIVLFHDDKLKRIVRRKGAIANYTYKQLWKMDFGKWFSADFAGTKIPTLQELLECVKDSDVKICLELKEIGDVDGFEEKILKIVKKYDMLDRCVFASFYYPYLEHLKKLDSDIKVCYFTKTASSTVIEEFPAEYYGMNIASVSAGIVDALHAAGAKVFAWTMDSPITITNVQELGVDGIITNRPGLAKVITQPKYSFLEERYQKSFTMPGLYEPTLLKECDDMIPQGFVRIGENMVVSAYSASGACDSILYVMDAKGVLQKTVDLKFKAHVGGIAYDELHDLLWVTGRDGMVYGLSWSAILDGSYAGEIQVSFDAGLVNHNKKKVASFLTMNQGILYVGSYVEGTNGKVKGYDITDLNLPILVDEFAIPERIQGIAFQENKLMGMRYLIVSQSGQKNESKLLRFIYRGDDRVYDEPEEAWVIPDGVQQIQMTANGLYVIFDTSARVYRKQTTLVNDQIYLLRM